jgi:predicted nucleotidyltransferase
MIPDFEKFLTILNQEEVEFVIIGGVAMVAHGSARATFDLDVCYKRSRENIARLCKALDPLHPRLRGAPKDLPFKFDVKTLGAGLNFTLATDLGDFDILGEVAGLGTYDAVLTSSMLKQIENTSCRVLTLDGLYKAKSAAGRGKDIEALKEIKGLKELKERLGEE